MFSDAIRACGMPEGIKCVAGGYDVWVQNGVGRLADGTISGSATNLFDGMVNAIRMGVGEENAIRAATYNPACAIGAATSVGSIETGKWADFIICTKDYSKKKVYISGEIV